VHPRARKARPAGRVPAATVLAHCFTCSKESAAASRISRGLSAHGIAVLRFDFTGLGQSGGDFANTSFSSNVADLIAAAQYLGSIARPPSLLVGHSLGGAAVIAAAAALPQVQAVVTVGAPGSPDHVTGLLGTARQRIERDGIADVVLAGRRFTVRREFLDDIAEQPQAQRLALLRRPLLVLHSPQDETVPVDDARLIFDAARHPKSFVALDGADHLLTRPADADFAAGIIAAWARRHLTGDTPPPDPRPRPLAEASEQPRQPAPAQPQRVAGEQDGVVVVRGGGPGLAHQVTARGHTWPADEPLEAGGTDTGPTPYDLLLSSLGACTAMTLRLYAERKGWDLGEVEVRLRHDRIHAEDCAGCDTTTGYLDRITRQIQVGADLDAEQRGALTRIADRCPVHRTLGSQLHIATELA
jgi:uncharacterized OsmC-like protein/pimeloyl-ACP methyl ester carboxylesterase